MKVLHICQNYNTKLFHKVFQTISRDPRIEQVVFYPYITKQNHLKSDRFIVYAVKSLPNIFRHFFLLRALVNFINLRKNVELKSFDIIDCHTLFNDGVVGFLASIFSERLIILTDVKGVLDKKGNLLTQIKVSEVNKLISNFK